MSDRYVGLLQREVERWSRANAPEATPATCLTHIRREIEELAAEVEAGDAEEAGVEMADIVISSPISPSCSTAISRARSSASGRSSKGGPMSATKKGSTGTSNEAQEPRIVIKHEETGEEKSLTASEFKEYMRADPGRALWRVVTTGMVDPESPSRMAEQARKYEEKIRTLTRKCEREAAKGDEQRRKLVEALVGRDEIAWPDEVDSFALVEKILLAVPFAKGVPEATRLALAFAGIGVVDRFGYRIGETHGESVDEDG